jgi:hypothetical protein
MKKLMRQEDFDSGDNLPDQRRKPPARFVPVSCNFVPDLEPFNPRMQQFIPSVLPLMINNLAYSVESPALFC